ncbi:YbhB/YbcL family Raf kinase inhibitor-like protein, partial [Cronobacter malonaticus]|uniref:YbhB/YbcL family Raf kinase inhibitor-like protein n=1 Tax=Cronobacter malonaticus TaxID=413503 RepID=UPI0021AB1635
MKKTLLACLLAVAAANAAAAPDDGIFMLQSPSFADNGMMEKKFAGNAKQNPNCTGENQSPALIWSHAPQGTTRFALVVHDPEGAKGLGVTHLVAYNIPATTTGLAANALTEGKGFTGGEKNPGTPARDGPPPGPFTHLPAPQAGRKLPCRPSLHKKKTPTLLV